MSYKQKILKAIQKYQKLSKGANPTLDMIQKISNLEYDKIVDILIEQQDNGICDYDSTNNIICLTHEGNFDYYKKVIVKLEGDDVEMYEICLSKNSNPIWSNYSFRRTSATNQKREYHYYTIYAENDILENKNIMELQQKLEDLWK